MIEINEKKVVFASLPQELAGLRILHLSDFHTHGFGRRERAVYDTMRRLRPDMVIISGDFCYHFGFSGSIFKSSTQENDHNYPFISRHGIWLPPETDKAVEVLTRLLDGFDCPLGVWGARGNHDPLDFVGRVAGLPIHFLQNSSELVSFRGVRIAVCGLDCSSRKSSDLVSVLKGMPEADFSMAISHYPEYGEPMVAGGCDLVFSGHTHGGQICLPGGRPILTHSRTGEYYSRGLVAFRHGWVHISRGIGKVMLPIRLFCPPEITLLTLERAVRIGFRQN